MTSGSQIVYRESPAVAPLAQVAAGFWEFQVAELKNPPYEHHVPPDGCVSLAVRYTADTERPAVVMVGPRTEAFVAPVYGGEHYLGVRLLPHAAKPLLGEQLEKSVGFVGPVEQLLPELAETLRSRLPAKFESQPIMAAFSEEVRKAVASDQLDPLVAAAVESLVRCGGLLSVAELAERLAISPRHLQRCFRAATGLTPKQFARIRRFRTAAAELLQAKPRPWVTVALDSGYSDQSHLSREFSQIVGLTAEELRAKHEAIEHHDVDP